MAGIDLEVGIEVAQGTKRLKELRQAAKDAVAGIAGDVDKTDAFFDELNKRIESTKKNLKGLPAEIKENDALIEKLTAQIQAAERKLKQATSGTIAQGFESNAAKAARAELERLNAELNDVRVLQKDAKQAFSDTKQELADYTKVVKMAKVELAALGEQKSVQSQMAAIRNEMMQLDQVGQHNSQRYRELQQELGALSESYKRVQREQKELLNGANVWKNMQTIMSGLLGVYASGVGVVGLFTSNTEKLIQIQTKLQSVMGIIIGLSQMTNAVHETQAFRVEMLAKVSTLWSSANKAVAASLQMLGLSATTANIAAQALMATLTLGLSIAITAAVAGINKLVNKHKDAKRAAEESAAAQRKAFESYAQSVASKATDTITTFNALKQQYEALGNSLQAKIKFINDNAEAFKQLGVNVTNANEADNLFIQNAEAFRESIQERAKAAAAMDIASERYKEAIMKMVEADSISARVNGKSLLTTGLSNEQIEEALKRYRSGVQDYKATHARSEDYTTLEKNAAEAGQKALDAYINSLKSGIEEEVSKLESEASKTIEAAQKLSNQSKETLSNAGINPYIDSKAESRAQKQPDKTLEAQKKAQEKLRDFILDSQNSLEQSRIDTLEEGVQKRIGQIRLNTTKELQALERRKKELAKLEEPEVSSDEYKEYKRVLEGFETERQNIIKKGKVAEQKIIDEENQKLLKGIETYFQKRQNIEDEYTTREKGLYNEDGSLKEGITEGNVEELNRSRDEALASIDQQFAEREETFNAWMNQIANMSIERLQEALEQAKSELESLEKSNSGDPKKLAVARAKVNTANEKLSKAKAENELAPDDKSFKKWAKLQNVLSDIAGQFDEIGDAIGGTAGKAIKTAGQIAGSALSMISGIEKLANASVSGIQKTGEASSKAMQAVETASVILTIITAAMSIAMKIINLFNNDETYQKEIEKLQRRIDALQWELDNAEAATLQKNTGDIVQRVKRAYEETTNSVVILHGAVNGYYGLIFRSFYKMRYNEEIVQKATKRLADEFANMAYTADKALGENKYASSREQLENLAEQQVLQAQQIEKERQKKHTDRDKVAKWEQEMAERAEEMQTIINEMVEDIIGGSAQEIASQLGNAFFEAFEEGEEAAEAWHKKVNDIVSDIVKRMLIQKVLEEPLGEIFDRYREKWFPNGEFQGIDEIMNSLGDFTDELNSTYTALSEAWSALSSGLKDIVTPDSILSAQEASARGFQAMSQDTGDELNGRFTDIQGKVTDIRDFVSLLISQNTDKLNEITNVRDIMIQLNGNIADIRTYTRVLPDMSETLISMNRKLDNL